METASGGMSPEELQWLCRSTLQARFPYFRNADVSACFYSYIGLTHTIRRKGNCWTLRISDHCRRAPRVVLEAITHILACKVMRRSPPREMVKVYERFRKEQTIETEVEVRRRKRGHKKINTQPGKYHSLWEIYCDVNQRYFNGQVEIKKI